MPNKMLNFPPPLPPPSSNKSQAHSLEKLPAAPATKQITLKELSLFHFVLLIR